MRKSAASEVMLFVILVNWASLGQTGKPSASPDKVPQAAVALSNQRQRALWTIKELFGISKTLRDEATRIRMEAQVADILWDYDEPRARDCFAESMQQLDSSESNGGGKALTSAETVQLRRTLMGMIARRDPKLAQRLLQAYAKSQKADQADPSLASETATNMAASDLQRAITTLRASMSGEITGEFLTSLRVIRELDPAAANDLFYKAMTLAAANDDEAFGRSLPILASYVFEVPNSLANSFPVQATSDQQDGNAPSVTENPAPTLDVALINNFLNFAFQALLPEDSLASRGPSGPGLPAYVALMQLKPYYEQYQPQQGSVIVDGFNQLAAAIRDPAKRALLVNLVGPVTPKQIVQAGPSLTNSDEQDIVYHRASLQASRCGDFEQALSIAGFIRDEKLRQDAQSVARTEAATLALSRGDLDSAYVSILSIPDLRQQAAMFAEIVRVLLRQKDAVRAGQILDSATRLMEKAKDTPHKVRALLLLFEVSAQIDTTRGTTILQLAASAMNRCDWADPPNASSSPNSKRAEATRSLPWFNFQGSFGLLARTDFDTALALAQSLRQQELSIGAQLAACQGMLNRKDPEPRKKQPVTRIHKGKAS